MAKLLRSWAGWFAAGTLALGIGAATALFAVVNGVLLRPLPYPASRQLMAVYGSTPQFERGYVTYLNFLDWQRDTKSFADLAIYRHADRLLTGAGQAESVTGLMVSADFFRTLGVAPVAGREFNAGDDHVGAAPAVMISGGLWRRQFENSRSILGRTLDLDGTAYTVIGVVPADFRFYGLSRDVYTAIGAWNDANLRDRRVDVSTNVIGRLRAGVREGAAQAEMDGEARRLAALYPAANAGVGVRLVPLQTAVAGDSGRYLWVLLAASGLLLLMACVNVANLLLARAGGRRLEYAIRAALGAGRARLLRQQWAEGVGLGLLGGVLGVGLAFAGERGLLAALPANLPRADEVHLNLRVLGFAVVVSLLAGLASGWIPALRASGSDLEGVLRSASSGGRRVGRGLPAVLVTAEMTLAVILLTGTGLMLRTLAALGRVDTGYAPGQAMTFNLALPARPDTTAAETRARLRAFDAGMAEIPGVEAESVTLGSRPMIHDSFLPFWIEGQPKPATNHDMAQALLYLAGPGYARAMGLTQVRGRFITAQDDEHAPPVIVIDRVFAEKYFPGQDAIGRQINFVGFGVRTTVIGVVDHVKEWGLGADPANAIEAEFFYPMLQLPDKLMPLAAGGVAVVVRARGNPEAVVAPVRAMVARLDAREVIYQTQTLEEQLAGSLAPRRATLALLEIFGGLALGLAATGVYGVMAFLVGRRRREMGIRAALGAGRGRILKMVVGDAARMAIWGAGLGVVAAVPLAAAARNLLFGVSGFDPLTAGGVAALLLGVAVTAAGAPAWRATQVDGREALRAE